VLKDKQFCNTPTLTRLHERGQGSVIGAPLTNNWSAVLVEHEDEAVRVQDPPGTVERILAVPSTMTGPAGEVQTTLILLDRRDTDTGETPRHAWVTDGEDPSCETAHALVQQYRKRWSIETGDRVKRQALAETTSPSVALRLLLVVSLLLDNVWVLVNGAMRDRNQPDPGLSVRYRSLRKQGVRGVVGMVDGGQAGVEAVGSGGVSAVGSGSVVSMMRFIPWFGVVCGVSRRVEGGGRSLGLVGWAGRVGVV
jgi:hypothetical protein